MLDRLKDELATRHIPVHVITTDEERERGLRIGAIGVLTKPIRNKEALDEVFGRIRKAVSSAKAPGARGGLRRAGAESPQ